MKYKTYKNLTVEQLRVLIVAHVQRYKRMLESGHPAVNVHDTTKYLNIWQGMLRYAMPPHGPDTFPVFTPAEDIELMDALASGNFDDLLDSSKLEKTNVRVNVLYVRSMVRAHVTVSWLEVEGDKETGKSHTSLVSFNSRGEFDMWVKRQREINNLDVKVECIETSRS